MKSENTPQLGLGPSPEKLTFLFVGEAEDETGHTAWYEMDFDSNKKIPVNHDSLTGYLTHIVIKPKVFKEKTNYKLDIYFQADHKYAIRSGAGTVFSRGFVLSLKQVIEDSGLEVLDNPITVSVSRGEEKSVFCGLFINGQKIIPKWDGSAQLLPLVQELQQKLGQVVQTQEFLNNPDAYWEAVQKAREMQKQVEAKPTPKRRISKAKKAGE